jgi:hypothetical protein
MSKLWRTSPATTKYAAMASINGAAGTARAALIGGNTANKHGLVARRLDADGATVAVSAADVSTASPQVQHGEFDWTNGAIRQFIANAQDGSGSPSSGGTSNTASTGFSIGASPAGSNNADIDVYGVVMKAGAAAVLSSANRALLAQYLSSLAGI